MNNLNLKKNKKILRITTSLNNYSGGIPRMVIDQTNELIKRGYNVEVVTLDKKLFFREKILFKIIKLGQDKKINRLSLKLFIWLLKNRKKYDLILIDGIWEFNTLVARLLFKKKYIVFIHGQLDPYFSTEFIKKIKKKIYWFLIERRNLLFSKFVILSGDEEVKMFQNTFVDTKKINFRNIDYGVTKYKFKNLRYSKIKIKKKYNLLLNKKYILFIGRIHKKKGCDLLINAIKEMDLSYNFKIVIAGFLDNSLYERKILNFIKKNNLHNDIWTLPFLDREEKFTLIKNSQCTILPSRGENFGITVVETLMMKKIPIITSKVGIYKIIKSFNAGLIFNPNINSLKKTLKIFFNLSSKKRKLIEENALNCYNNFFSSRTTIVKLEKIIDENII